ncbi:MAG: TonB-dependent receptor [Salinivirgaceae bacterium]|jgi:hypothetical protein|nr:TonB-dependent receptor [Salinivirgaceae bacterium]
MKKILVLVFAVVSVITYATESKESNKANKKGDIVGTVIDNADGRPIEYATIALYKSESKELVTGVISDSEGFFRLKNNAVANYYLTVTFLGYNTVTIPDIKILEDTREIELGNLKLAPNSREIEGVDVMADQASVQYKIDKKIINVGQQLTAKSGTAVDILENVPSVKVDIDGNVSLRGSTSFTVLIDGRPTVLDPSDALSQMPSGAIENIEIITNPSAKYEPDGTSGIINIVTKKNKLNGTSGIVNVNVGRFENYGSDFTLENRMEKLRLFLGADYNNRNRPGDMKYQRDLFFLDDTTNIQSDGKFARNRQRYSFRTGMDWDFTSNDVIGINVRAGDRFNERSTEKNYYEYNSETGIETLSKTEDNSSRGGYFWSVAMNYRHNFNKDKTHFIEFQTNVHGRNGDEESENIERNLKNEILTGQRSTEIGPSSDLRLKLDYTKPFDWGGKFETGWQSHYSISNDENKVYHFDTLNNNYVFQQRYSNNTKYTRNTHALYGTFGGEYGDFGYQAGLRAEYTYRFVELTETNEEFLIDRPDFFPTLHFSYQMPAEQQAMISYTRRINRPRGWFLEPFITYMDAYNVRKGNPGLDPEYINSVDLSYQKKFQKQNFASVEGYYRNTVNKIERYKTPFIDDTSKLKLMHSFINAGADYALGVEFMLNYSPTKWYTTNLMADLYDYTLKGELNELAYEQHDFSWNFRFNNTLKAGMNSRFQIDFMYQSASVQAQGRTEDFYAASVAYKQDFFKRKMSATLQIRDVLGTWQHEHITRGVDFYEYSLYKPNTPSVMLTLSYKINNYKANRSERNGNGGGEEGGDNM